LGYLSSINEKVNIPFPTVLVALIYINYILCIFDHFLNMPVNYGITVGLGIHKNWNNFNWKLLHWFNQTWLYPWVTRRVILRSRTCLLWVFGAVRVAHPCCDFRIKTIFSSSLPPAVCRKTRVLFTLFVLAASSWSCSSFCEFPIPQLSHSSQAYSKSGLIYTR
jgi:hypothetical protein